MPFRGIRLIYIYIYIYNQIFSTLRNKFLSINGSIFDAKNFLINSQIVDEVTVGYVFMQIDVTLFKRFLAKQKENTRNL